MEISYDNKSCKVIFKSEDRKDQFEFDFNEQLISNKLDLNKEQQQRFLVWYINKGIIYFIPFCLFIFNLF